MTTETSGRLTAPCTASSRRRFEHCALIREWLTDLGIDRVTLCVTMAPVPGGALDGWLRERRDRGDAVAGPWPEDPAVLRRAAAERRPATLQVPSARLGADVAGVLGAP